MNRKICAMLFVFSIASSALSASADRAYKYYLDGFLTRAAEEYLMNYRLSPGSIKPLLNAAIIYKQMGKYNKTENLLEKALIAWPKNTDVLCELGWIKFHLAKYREAARLFETACQARPLYERALLGLGSAYAHLGEKEKAIKYLKKYKKLRPDFSGADYIIAWNYFNFNMKDKAKHYLIEALRKDPSFIEARLPLAGIYAREKEFNEAWNQYYRVLDYVPNHPLALKMVKLLEGKLTRQPEEIRPPFKFKPPPKVPYIDVIEEIKKSVNMRIGIGTNNQGRQRKNKRLKFKSYSGFKIIGKRSGKIYVKTRSQKSWRAEYSKRRVIIKNNRGTVFGRFKGTIIIAPNDLKNGYIVFQRDKWSSNPWFRNSDRAYRGYIELSPSKRGIKIVNVVDMEVYLLGVVPAEVMSWWPYETLKAQAVIARTQAIIRRKGGGKHKKQGYHLCDSQHCQVYAGVISENTRTNKAVYDTEGEILVYKKRPAETFYHSNCGGYIQASKNVFGWGDVPYLRSHQDTLPGNEYQLDSPWDFHKWLLSNPPANCNMPQITPVIHFRWLRIIKHKDLETRINKSYRIDKLKNIFPLKRSPSGNVNSLRIIGSRKTVDIKKEHLIRNLLGLASIKSTLFFMKLINSRTGKREITGYTAEDGDMEWDFVRREPPGSRKNTTKITSKF